MKHIIKVTLETTKSNINIPEGRIGRWFFKWENNKITAFALSYYKSMQISDPFELVRGTSKLNLGLLIDCLTIAANQDINTSIDITTEPIINVLKPNKNAKINSVKNAIRFSRTSKNICRASSMSSNLIDESITITFSKEELGIIKMLVKNFQKVKITNSDLKLMNYWRKGVELDRLTFTDESYLAFYKIIEYFISKSSLSNSFCGKIIKQISSVLPLTLIQKNIDTNALQGAKRFADGANLTKFNDDNLKLISEFIHMRNNWDVAHMRMKPLPEDRSSKLYYSHIENAWDYHSHICQITRLVILKNMNFGGLMLKGDGGLLKLTTAK